MNRADDYPEHLNPFDDNYDNVEAPTSSRQKYNTWSGKRGHQLNATLVKQQDKEKDKWSFFGKPWAGKGKLVRRLSVLKTAVERVSFRRKRGQSPQEPFHRSNSLHEDLAYRITSPKVKERLREQALPALVRLKQIEASSTDTPSSPQPNSNGRLHSPLPLNDEDEPNSNSTNNNNSFMNGSEPTTPNSGLKEQGQEQGVRPKTRKKKPPPPPPPVAKVELTNGLNKSGKSEDSISACSSITQELEKALSNGDCDSLAEFEFDKEKLDLHSTI